PDAGLPAANSNADASFTSDPVGGVVASCPLSNPPAHPPPPGNLIVHVRNGSATGAAISGATVNISGPAAQSGTTDATDRAVFNGLTPGSYNVAARKNAHLPDPATGTATVMSGATAEVTLVLTPIVLEIVDQDSGNVVSDTTTTKIVGQRINLQ